MKFTIDADILKIALSKTKEIVEKKSIFVTSHIYIEAQENQQVKIFSTNFNVSHEGDYSAVVTKAGKCVLNGNILWDISKNLPSKPVNFNETQPLIINMSCHRSKFKLQGLSHIDYPKTDFEYSQKNAVPFQSTFLLDIIEKAGHAMGSDESRMGLCGLNFEFLGKKLIVRATDSYKASLIERDLEFPEKFTITLHRSGVKILQLFLLGKEFTCKMVITKSDILVISEKFNLSIKQIFDVFPNIPMSVNSKWKVKIRIDKKNLQQAIRRISSVLDSVKNTITITLNKGTSIIKAVGQDNSAGEVFGMEIVDGEIPEENTVNLNHKVLSSILACNTHTEIELRYESNNKPVVFVNPLDPNHVSFMMPISMI